MNLLPHGDLLAHVDLLAHGVGGRHDLPIPLFYAVGGAAAAVFVSFLALGLLWAYPRFRGDTAGWPLPRPVQAFTADAALRWALRAGGLAVTAFVVVTALLGPGDDRNLAAGFVYVFFWVGLVPASLLLGPVWRLVNPLRTVHLVLSALAGRDPAHGRRTLPQWLGYWPAAAGLLAFTWLELVAPAGTAPSTLLLWFTGYAAVQLAGAFGYGSRWFDRCDAFEVYSGLIGRLAPLGRRGDGRLVVRNPFHGLDGTSPAPGLVATVCVLLASTAYDSFSDAPVWTRWAEGGPLHPVVAGTAGLAGTVALFALLYVACMAVAALRGRQRTAAVAVRFAHTLVPIAVGYLVAHYFSLLVFGGQRTLILASDPLATGADLFGTAGREVDLSVVSPGTIATVQVLAVVAGHVAGTVAAHDRAVAFFLSGQAVAGQVPLMVLMVTYTLVGLTLLFAA